MKKNLASMYLGFLVFADTRLFILSLVATLSSIVGGMWVWARDHPMNYRNPDYPIISVKRTMLEHCNIGTLDILGASNAATDFNPTLIGAGVVNFALVFGTPVENFFLAEKILKCPVPPRAIVMSFPLKHFTFFNYDILREYVADGVLDYEALREVRQELWQGDRESMRLPSYVEQELNDRIATSWFPAKHMKSILASLLAPKESRNKFVYKNVMQARGTFFFAGPSVSPFENMDLLHKYFAPIPIQNFYFDKTLQLFSSHHIPVYFVYLPYNRKSYQVPLQAMNQFGAYLQRYATRYLNFHILGQAYTEFPGFYFYDALHLNTKGSVIWSEIARKILNDANVPGGPFLPETTQPAGKCTNMV